MLAVLLLRRKIAAKEERGLYHLLWRCSSRLPDV